MLLGRVKRKPKAHWGAHEGTYTRTQLLSIRFFGLRLVTTHMRKRFFTFDSMIYMR